LEWTFVVRIRKQGTTGTNALNTWIRLPQILRGVVER
jgi:hypothetical protein